MSFFSTDCMEWNYLTPATEEMATKAKLAKGRFTGDPSNEFEHMENKKKKAGEGDEIAAEEESVSSKRT